MQNEDQTAFPVAMPFFSRFFGDAQTRRLKKLLAESEERVKREYSPISRIGATVIEAATHCRDWAKSVISAATEKDRQEREIYIFYEFLYFFMHMSNRQAFACLTEAHIKKLHDYLGPLISSVAIDAYFAHWPADLKEKMTGEFYEKLNTAELDYTDATRADSYKEVPWGSPVPLENLFLRLGSNISALALDDGNNQSVITSVSEFAFGEWNRMGLKEMMLQAKAADPDAKPGAL